MDDKKCSQKGFLGKKLSAPGPPEHKQPSIQGSPGAAWRQPTVQSSAQQGPQTQDWVSEQPELRRPSRHWSISIDERRRLAMLGGLERPGTGTNGHYREIAQVVSQLVSEDVDKDVLIPHPPRSAESTNAFRAFLCRSAPFWQNASSEQCADEVPGDGRNWSPAATRLPPEPLLEGVTAVPTFSIKTLSPAKPHPTPSTGVA